MSRGRPRRINVRRKPSGDVVESQAHRQEDPRTLTAWTRYRDHAVELALDERLSSLAGRLFFTRRLTAAQFEAATRWSRMLDEYDVLILGKRRVTKPPAYERQSPGESSERSQDRIRLFLVAFHAAHAALLVAGKLSEVAVNRLCRDEGVGALFDDIARGLDALAAHWGLTGKAKHASRG